MGAKDNNVTRRTTRGSARESVAERARMKDTEQWERGTMGCRECGRDSTPLLRVVPSRRLGLWGLGELGVELLDQVWRIR